MKKLPERYVADGREAGGGMGAVIFCDDTHLDRKVAIKFIADAQNRHRMLDELKALLKMRSKHVVQVFDVVSDGDELGIVQEYIEGTDLSEIGLPFASSDLYIRALWQIAAGIADIHAIDVIHRDIKPNNMRLDPEGIVKIYDFGLARDEGRDAKTRGFVGTPYFAAPELFRFADVLFTKAVDVYAFGVTALYLATKSLPDQLKAIPPRLGGANFFGTVDIPLPVIQILNQCLKEAPETRPEMTEVRDTLARYLLKDKHEAVVVFQQRSSSLNAATREVRLNLPNMGALRIYYDGLTFNVLDVFGDVYINNRQAVDNMVLPGSCVVALGPPQSRDRKYITFDLSQPEIVL